MKLSPISVGTRNINPNFEAQYISVRYKNIKNIPDIPCACCGKKVLIPEQLSQVFRKVERPLVSIMKLGTLDFVKANFPEVWSVLEKFAQEHPKDSFEHIINSGNAYKILSKVIKKTTQKEDNDNNNSSIWFERSKNILYAARSGLRSSGVVMRAFAPLKKYLDGTKLETFEQLEIYSRKYPRKTLKEIINMPEIYKFHKMKDLLQRAETREKVEYRFENIRNMVKKANPEVVENFDSIKDTAMDIFANNDDPMIRMTKIKQLYQMALESCRCEHLTKKVHAEIDNMPVTYLTTDSFLLYAHNHNYNDGQILTSIFGPVTSTFEHVVPRSEEGKDKMGNGLVMHKSCNQHRGNLSYEEFFEYHPEMPKNIQKQVNSIIRQILNGKLDKEFRYWPLSIVKTLQKYTQGAVNLDITRYCQKAIEQTQQQVDRRTETIGKLRSEHDEKVARRLELKKQIEALESEMQTISDNVQELNQDNMEEEKFINILNSKLKKNNSKQE